MLLERVLGVAAQAVLGVVARLLGTLLGSCALAVDVVGRLAGLRAGLALGLGGLAAGVGGGHGCGLGGCVWSWLGCLAGVLVRSGRMLGEWMGREGGGAMAE